MTHIALKKPFLLACCLALYSHGAVADLSGVTIDCRFRSSGTATTLNNGQLVNEKDDSRDIIVTFTDFKANGQAMLIGNSGAAEVYYDERDSVLLLVQLFGSAIRTFTSMNVPKPSQIVKAVHSRHVWFPGTGGGVFSQWTGDCNRR